MTPTEGVPIRPLVTRDEMDTAFRHLELTPGDGRGIDDYASYDLPRGFLLRVAATLREQSSLLQEAREALGFHGRHHDGCKVGSQVAWLPKDAFECTCGIGAMMAKLHSVAPALPARVESLESQIDRLARFIMSEIPGEPSRSEGAVDTAIRLLRAVAASPTQPEEPKA